MASGLSGPASTRTPDFGVHVLELKESIAHLEQRLGIIAEDEEDWHTDEPRMTEPVWRPPTGVWIAVGLGLLLWLGAVVIVWRLISR